uniref:ABC transporter substrate-binding protein n=1 Tax=Acidobacterium capsulatum TaxID=33075 RepID=A0A7V4XRE4_9BACT
MTPPRRLSAALSAVLSLLLLCVPLLGCSPPRSSDIVIGAKDFTEQTLLGELLAQEIEAKTHLKVDRHFYLAGSYICQQALLAGRIDAYVEYTGTALTAILKQPIDRNPQQVFDTVQRLYQQRYHVTVFPSLGFQNTFAMVVRPSTAQRLHATTLSQLAPYASRLRLGVGYEFQTRPDGLRGLEKAYGMHFAGTPRVMDLGLLYRALESHQVDIIAANSTDGPIAAAHLVILKDDRHFFPPYQAVPLVSDAALRRWPQIRPVLASLAGKITAAEMRQMNEEVDGEHRDPAAVIREFRKEHGL